MQQKPPNFYRHNELNDFNKDRQRKVSPWGALILLLVIVGGLVILFTHGSKNNGLPLPSSAKTISTNTIQVPFPYVESSNGEKWTLVHDTSNQLALQVSDGGIIESFPVKTSTNSSITLGGQKYTISHIQVNNDATSGSVTLVKQ